MFGAQGDARGAIVKGRVTTVFPNRLLVDIGSKFPALVRLDGTGSVAFSGLNGRGGFFVNKNALLCAHLHARGVLGRL